MAYGRKILLMAVLAILSTAPIGAVLISILGPKLLTKNQSQGNAGKRSSDISLNENNSKNYIHSS